MGVLHIVTSYQAPQYHNTEISNVSSLILWPFTVLEGVCFYKSFHISLSTTVAPGPVGSYNLDSVSTPGKFILTWTVRKYLQCM